MLWYILGGAATCSEGFVKCFLKVPQATAAAMLPKQAKGTFRKHITKPSEQVAAPPSIYILRSVDFWGRKCVKTALGVLWADKANDPSRVHGV